MQERSREGGPSCPQRQVSSAGDQPCRQEPDSGEPTQDEAKLPAAGGPGTAGGTPNRQGEEVLATRQAAGGRQLVVRDHADGPLRALSASGRERDPADPTASLRRQPARGGKIVSLFEPHSQVIRKGKAHIAFGKLGGGVSSRQSCESCEVKVLVPPIACSRADSKSDACEGNDARSARM